MIEPDDDLTIGDVEEFFTKYGEDEVANHDLGYGCDQPISIDDLYEMFRARMRLEL